MADILLDTDEKRAMISVGGGCATIFGPDGREISKPLDPKKEGLVYAEIDLSAIVKVKQILDPIGHYSRPDVLQLKFDAKPKSRVISMSSESLVPDARITAPAPKINE